MCPPMPALWVMKFIVHEELLWQAKELGVRSLILDGPDSWCQTLEKDGVIEKFIPLDFSDAESVFQRALDAITKAQAVSSPGNLCISPAASGPRLPLRRFLPSMLLPIGKQHFGFNEPVLLCDGCTTSAQPPHNRLCNVG